MTTAESPARVWSVRLLVAAPFGWLVLFYLFVLRTRVRLGYWPRYNDPDPKNLGFDFHHALVWLGAVAFPLVVLSALALALFGYLAGRRPFPWLLIGAAALSVAAVLASACLDPGEFYGWFVD